MMRRAALALVLVLTSAAFAEGDDPKAPAAPAAPLAKEADKPSGTHAKVVLNNGRSISGVIRAEGSWERLDAKAGWVACGKDDAGASVRLWYAFGGEGFMVIAAKDTKALELGDAVDPNKLSKDIADAEKRATEERERVRKDLAIKKAEWAKQAAMAPKPLTPEQARLKALADAADARGAELLAKFPRKDWSAERRDEINRRALIMKLMPTADEREFLDNFDDWARAAAAEAAKEVADKADAEKKAAEKKAEDAKKDGKTDGNAKPAEKPAPEKKDEGAKGYKK
jgi:hypothetical protein